MEEHGQNNDVRADRSRFIAYILGFFLTFSAYLSVLNLQSSINIEDGLGTISVAVTYGVSTVFMIFFTPISLRTFGPKKCLIVSQFTYMVYILANLYPKFYTLIPAAMIVGIGEAMLWPSTAIMNVYFAMQYAEKRKHPTKESNFYINLYSGYFFITLQCCQIFGNLLTYAVLYGFSRDANTGSDAITTTAEMITTDEPIDRYQFCGAKDCQDQDTIGDSIDQYVPTSKLAIIILISILTALCIIALTVNMIFLPADSYRWERHQTKNLDRGQESQANENNHEEPTDKTGSVGLQCIVTNSKDSETNTAWNQYTKALKDTVIQMKDTRQLLLTPLCLYLGFLEAFVFSELTRAYSSCVVGVATVGLHMATFGLSDAILSWIVGKFGNKWGSTTFFIFSTLIDIGCYSYCLLWDPNLESSWSIFLLFFAFGVSDGIWQTLLNVLHLLYFESNRVVAITIWNFWLTIGFTIQFAWSTSLCVFVKIYVQLALLGTGMLCYAFADRLNRNLKRTGDSVEETRL